MLSLYSFGFYSTLWLPSCEFSQTLSQWKMMVLVQLFVTFNKFVLLTAPLKQKKLIDEPISSFSIILVILILSVFNFYLFLPKRLLNWVENKLTSDPLFIKYSVLVKICVDNLRNKTESLQNS